MEISNRGGGPKIMKNFPTYFQFFFENGDFSILHVSWPENARNGMKKNYPTSHVKNGYFQTLGGGGGGLRKVGMFQFF